MYYDSESKAVSTFVSKDKLYTWKFCNMDYGEDPPENFKKDGEDTYVRPYQFNDKEQAFLVGTDHPNCFAVYSKMGNWEVAEQIKINDWELTESMYYRDPSRPVKL